MSEKAVSPQSPPPSGRKNEALTEPSAQPDASKPQKDFSKEQRGVLKDKIKGKKLGLLILK